MPEQNLDNSIPCTDYSSTQPKDGVDDILDYKIVRKVCIHGSVHLIRARTEQEYCDKILSFAGAKTPEPTVKHRFSEYAINWFEVYSKPNIEESTALSYKKQLRKYLLPWFGELNVEDISTARIQELFNSMDTAKATKDKVKIVLNQILECAVEDGYLEKNPLKSKRLKINGKESKETPPYTVEQMRYMVNNVDQIANEQDRLFLVLMCFHPLRLEEVLGLRWEDVNFKDGYLAIRRAVIHPDRNQPLIKSPKTEKSKRDIALSSVAARYLSSAVNKTGFIIGGETPLSRIQVTHMCARIQKAIGFEEKITPIRFRTTVLTDIYDQTKDIKLTSQSGGHTTADMTLKHYVKGREKLTKTAQAIDALYS